MNTRRALLASATLATASTALQAKAESTKPARRATYVLAHGSFHGGWCWRFVSDILVRKGHKVFSPSYTGMGERSHLLSKSITIDTFITDLVNLIEVEELQDVVLVGHSFGGVPITGVAARIPSRLRQMVYLDAIVLEPGKHAFSVYLRIPLIADTHSKQIADSVPGDYGHRWEWGLSDAGDGRPSVRDEFGTLSAISLERRGRQPG